MLNSRRSKAKEQFFLSLKEVSIVIYIYYIHTCTLTQGGGGLGPFHRAFRKMFKNTKIRTAEMLSKTCIINWAFAIS